MFSGRSDDEGACDATEAGKASAPAAMPGLPRGSVHRQVFMLACPVLGEQAVRFLVGFVDTLLAGQISKEATAAVGTAIYFTWLVILLFNLVTIGTIALVSRMMGAGDRRGANRIVNQALLLSVIVGAVATGFAFAMATPMAQLLTQTEAAYDLFVMYLRIESLGFVLVSLAILIMAVLRAAGDTHTPMYVMFVMNIINVIASVALVYDWFGFGLGTAGIAVGTLIARAVSAVLVIWVLWQRPRGFRVRRALLWPQWANIRRILKISLPASVDAAIMGVSQLAFAAIVVRTAVGEMSTVHFAAHNIAMRMEALSYLPAIAWAVAGSTVAGQYLGAKRPEDAARGGHSAALQVAALTTVIGALFVIFAGPIYGLMTDDPAVRAVGAPAFRMLGIIQPILAMAIAYTHILRNIGDSRTTLLFTFIGSMIVRVPLAYLGGIVLQGGLIGAWCGMWGDNLAKFALSGSRFLRGGWKNIEV